MTDDHTPPAAKHGIIGIGGYVPWNRLERAQISAALGGRSGKGTRAVASYDEDTTTLAVEAARVALAGAPDPAPRNLVFATAEPAYLDKTNATAIWAALGLDAAVAVSDAGGSPRSGIAALNAALDRNSPTLVIASGMRTGLPSSADESAGGDGAAAVLVGTDADGPLIAEFVTTASATAEFLDRWRLPGSNHSRAWEERFAESQYAPLAEAAWADALKQAELTAAEIDTVVLTGTHARAVKRAGRILGVDADSFADDLSATVGNTGASHALLMLAGALETAQAGQTIAVVSVSDGVDVTILRTTAAIADWAVTRSVARQVATGDDSLPYPKFLGWRGMLEVEPPNRPAANRPSAPAAARRSDWKFGFVGNRDPQSGALSLPPRRVSWDPADGEADAVDNMQATPMAGATGTIASFTIDRLAYSPSPPIVFAVVDFDGGGRLPVELTDVSADAVATGDRVEMTFRRLFTADEIHNYFWKARPVRVPDAGEES